MIRPLEPQDEKFRQCQMLLRASGYRGVLPLIALTIDPERGTLWYTDGTAEGTSFPKASTTLWSWYLIDLDDGVCFKGGKLEVLQTLNRAAGTRDRKIRRSA